MNRSGSLEDYLEAVQSTIKAHPSYREGQAFFNTLALQRPDLSEQIVGTDLDPYATDKRIGGFLRWIEAHW